MTNDLIEKVARAIVGGVIMDSQRDEVTQEAKAAIAVVLREVAKRDICDTAEEIARENGVSLDD